MIPLTTTATRSAFTLLELVVSLVVTTILIGALTSVMLLATQIVPDSQGPAQATISASEIANQIAGELYYAQSFTERSAGAVTFTVADRDGDDTPETIRYAWSGRPGDPLTRQYNDGDPGNVLDNVQELALDYEINEVIDEVTGSPTESPEMKLAGYETFGTLKGYRVTNDKWIGQCFRPALPSEALGWRVTRVRVSARTTGGIKGLTMVQLRPANGSMKPTSTLIEEVPMFESDLTADYTWQESPFTKTVWLSPSDAICVVLRQIGKGGSTAEIGYDDQGGSDRVATSDGGSTWSRDTGRSLLHSAYGTMTTTSPPEIIRRYLLAGVQMTLQVGSDPPTTVRAATRILNKPEVATP